MSDIFISYAREDQRVADSLAKLLTSGGRDVFVDRDAIPGGVDFDEYIDHQLAKTKLVIVLWSSVSVTSRWVKGEAREALEQRKLLPVLIEERIRMPIDFRGTNATPLVAWTGNADAPQFCKLLRDIEAHLGEPARSDATAPASATVEKFALHSGVPAPARPNEMNEQERAMHSTVEAPNSELPTPQDSKAASIRLADLHGPAWVEVSEGSFEMGDSSESDAAPHRVTLHAFRICTYPITNAEYRVFVSATNHRAPAHWERGMVPAGKINDPVVNVSWNDAAAFAAWLSEIIRRRFGGTVELPTEAQWEYAARGQEGRMYPWGSEKPTDRRANFANPSRGTTPVGSYPQGATPNGIYDLAGNVWEWCRDWYEGTYDLTVQEDPAGPPTGRSRALRGGAFYLSARYLRATYRNNRAPNIVNHTLGFRLVWSTAGTHNAVV